MVRRLAAGAVVAVAILVGRADASCTDSQVMIMVPPVVSHPTIPVRWTVGSGCRVIETGLLFGVDPNALNPAGAPVYAARAEYHGSVQASESGMYWLAAYAVDESGAVAYSQRRRVIVSVVPLPPPGPHGSHGPPLTYTGTDADFLQPAGEPHYASLRWVTHTTEGVFGFVENSPNIAVFGAHLVASTNPNEVRAELMRGVTLGGAFFPTDPVTLEQSLASYDVIFPSQQFPRPGLYTVECGIFGTVSLIFARPPATCRVVFGDLGLAYHETVRDTVTGFGLDRQTFSARTSLTYFVPAAPLGKQVDRATVRMLAHAIGDIETIRINGERPIALSPIGQCRPASCSLFITWDFTEKVRALAAQGGGELPLTVDPIAPHVTEGGNFIERTGRLGLGVQVNYPWKHLFLGLSISYKEACPRDLRLEVVPDVVRPQVPPTTRLTGPVASLQTDALVQATVRTCPGGGSTPAAVDVTFKVKAPELGSAEAAGHAAPHVNPRPQAALGKLEPTTCRITNFDAEGRGSCPVKYTSSEVSGVETLEAEAIGLPDIPKATAKVTVEVPGLVELPEDLARYVLVGAPQNHAGTNDPCRGTPPASRHPQNHFGQPRLNTAVVAIAERMLQETGILLRVNDMSLVRGGLFDIRNNWISPHSGHRIGLNADIGFSGVRNGACVDYDRQRLEETVREVNRRRPRIESDHFHVSLE